MNSKKQKLLLEYLISSPDIFAICAGILKSQYFNPEYRNGVKFIMEYYNAHNSIPSTDQVEAETDVELNLRHITSDQFAYCCSEVESFCRQSAMRAAILAAPALLEKGEDNYAAIEASFKDALTISLRNDMGTNFFEDISESLKRITAPGSNISTLWKDVDQILFGGIQKKQLILFSAGSGGGKSITMQNLGLNLVCQGLHVLYLSLELSEDLLSERLATMVSGVGKQEIAANLDSVIAKVGDFARSYENVGSFTLKQMPSGVNCNNIRAYLKEYELKYGYLPDAIIVDYLDLMTPMDRVSADNVFEKDKRVSEELRNIAVELNTVVITASQLNRSAVGAESINHSHIAGGISKVNTCDVYITIILSETLKAAGEVAFHYQKTRNSDGVGKTTYLKWDAASLRISNKAENRTSLAVPPKVVTSLKKTKSKSITTMWDESDLD